LASLSAPGSGAGMEYKKELRFMGGEPTDWGGELAM